MEIVAPTAVPVVPVETVLEPTLVPTEVPVDPTVVPDPPTQPAPTQIPTPLPSETVVPTAAPATSVATEVLTPTPTPEVIVPDQMALTSGASVTIAQGESRDITIRSTLGSNRESTSITASAVEASGLPSDGWTIVPVNRANTITDPSGHAAGVSITDVTTNAATVDTTWRVTAPSHIEQPLTFTVNVTSKIHRIDGITDGANLVPASQISATAAVHAPTFVCSESASLAWACSFDTTHPAAITLGATVTAPAGWEIKLNSNLLSATPYQLDSVVQSAKTFALVATYPIGCPDVAGPESASITLTYTYPSGEVVVLKQDIALTFVRPQPTVAIDSFSIQEFNQMETLSTTGQLAIAYTSAPCAWQATVDLTEVHSDTLPLPDMVITVDGVQAPEGVSVTMSGSTLSILAAESTSSNASGTITITITLAYTFPHQVPPGAYSIGAVISIAWLDEN